MMRPWLQSYYRSTTPLGLNVLGCTAFDIDDRVLQFDGVTTYESLLARLADISAEHAAKSAARAMSIGQESFLQDQHNAASLARLDVRALHAAVTGRPAELFGDDGRSLMAAAFRIPKGGRPCLALNRCQTLSETSEREGLQLLAMGSMALFRNKFSHGDAPTVDHDVALEMLGLASLLFRELERTQTFAQLGDES